MDPGELILVFALMKLSKIFNVIFKWGKERTKKQTNKTKCPRPMKVTTCPYGRGSTRLKIELLSPQAGPDRGLGPLGRVSCSWSRAVFEEPQGGMGPPVKRPFAHPENAPTTNSVCTPLQHHRTSQPPCGRLSSAVFPRAAITKHRKLGSLRNHTRFPQSWRPEL